MFLKGTASRNLVNPHMKVGKYWSPDPVYDNSPTQSTMNLVEWLLNEWFWPFWSGLINNNNSLHLRSPLTQPHSFLSIKTIHEISS